ncbi:dTDP-glucose 4,6-dehydratase [Rickettsiales bacterium LUAb2]
MKMLVTGGAGFIGSNFIRYILEKYPNYFITNLDALTYAGNLNNLSDISNNPNYQFIHGNILDENLVFKLMQEVDICVNFAAESHVDNSIANPSPFIDTNIKGTFNLLEQAKKTNLRKFVHISTDEVYGSLDTTNTFATEDYPLLPNSPYAASKAASDLLVRSYFQTFNLPVLITRCGNNYGEYQHKEKLIPLVINNLLNNKKIPLYGDGLNIRDWIYVKDHCYGIDLVLHNGTHGEIYNINSNEPKTNIDLIKVILSKLNKDTDTIEYVTDRLGHDRRYAMDNSKITKQLGFSSKFTFEKSIEHTINWYKNNLNTLKD